MIIKTFAKMFAANNEPLQQANGFDHQAGEPQIPQKRSSPNFATIEVGELGQRNEELRLGIQEISARLLQIESIRLSFESLSEPILSVIDELPGIRFKLADADHLLQAEREAAHLLRQERSDLAGQAGTLGDELRAVQAQVANFQEDAGQLNLALGQLRIEHEQSAQAAAEATKLLAVEVERTRALTEDNQLLRYESEIADRALARGERERSELAGRSRLLEQDNEIVQKAHEALLDRLSVVEGRLSDATQRLEGLRQTSAELEGKVNTERGLRERVERQRETERASHMSQVGALEMRVEGFTARVAINENILSTTRDQLREANDAVRLAERHAKEAIIDRNSFERRVLVLEADAEKEALQSLSFEQRLAEVNQQNAQLGKAVAEKQMLREQAEIRHLGASERLEEMSRRMLADRAQAELVQQNLQRELTQERSERTLIHGALETVRAQRESLLAELQALKTPSYPADRTIATQEMPSTAETLKEAQPFEDRHAVNEPPPPASAKAAPINVELRNSVEPDELPDNAALPLANKARQPPEAHPLLI